MKYTFPLRYLLYEFEGRLMYWEPNTPGTISVQCKATDVCLHGHAWVGGERTDGTVSVSIGDTLAQYVV